MHVPFRSSSDRDTYLVFIGTEVKFKILEYDEIIKGTGIDRGGKSMNRSFKT